MNRTLLSRLSAIALAGALWQVATGAQASDALLNKLVEKGILNQREANEIRAELGAEQAAAVEAYSKVKVNSWVDELKWSGDLRGRVEYFDNEDQSNVNDRWRYRIRLRLGLEFKFPDWAKVGIRLATGGDDPVSTNQSLQDTFSKKPFNVDLAYVTLQPPGWDWIAVSGGKIKNPIWQPDWLSPMQYDGDVTPEGLGEEFSFPFGDKDQHAIFLNFGQYVLDEIGGDANDPFLFDFQGGAELKMGEDVKNPHLKATVAGGFMLTHNVDKMGVASGSQPAGAASPGSQSSSGNRGNATSQPGGAGTTLFYLDDFQVLYGRAELAWQVSDQPFLGTPALVTFSGEYLTNLAGRYDNLKSSTQTASPDQTDGYTAQIKFGKAKKQGQWEIAYQYKVLEADATWDALTDSDWGLGGTDRRGHVIAGAYNVRDWWQLGIKAFITEKISGRPNSGENTRGTGTDELLRVQMDSVFKF
jgi:hypothetical protein